MPKSSIPVTHHNARFTVYSDGCVRLEYAHGGAFSPYPSLLTGGHKAKPVKADVVRRKNGLTIRMSRFELVYKDNGERFSAENLKIVHRNHVGDREVWTPGKADTGNLGTVQRCLDHWKWCGGPAHRPVEGILSTQGGHFLEDKPRVYWNEQHQWPENMAGKVACDGWFFAYGNDYKSALRDFVNVLGPIPMVPRWTFGFWYSRWYAYKDREFVDLVKAYRKHGIPIDVMIIDTDWRAGWGGYDWTGTHFPNPEKTMAELHGLGVRTSLNDHPGYDNFDALPDGDSHIPEIAKRLGPLPHKGEWACDWSRKDAVQAWREVLLGPFFDQGMDFWWIDGWIDTPFGETDSQLWANYHYFDLAEEKTGKRGLILSRWGGIGSHRYPVQFSGDTPSQWEALRFQVEYTARSGNLGAAYWSHDIGGFFGKKIDEELLIRWMQFGAMSPVLRTHSDHGLREPWHYSKKAVELFRKQTRIRYALAPYFYTLSHEAHTTGMPLVRPLYLEYNDNDGGALYKKHQYTVGRDLLVIPADGPIEKPRRAFRKAAYFPDGTWYGLETSEVYKGLLDTHVEIPLERINTYVRGGAILPSQEVGEYLGTATPERLHLDIFPDPDRESVYELYEDDGETREHLKGRSATTRIRARMKQASYEVTIDAPKGTYRGMPRKRTFVVQVRLAGDESIKRVTARVANKASRELEHGLTSQCLAHTVESRHRFCRVEVTTARQAVRLSFKRD